MKKSEDKRDLFIDLFDHYVHSDEPRRAFLQKLVKAAGGVAAAATVLPWLEGTGAEAAMVAPDDKRLTEKMESFLTGGVQMNVYVVRQRSARGKQPTVVVIHENRGLTPHIQDVARRVALEGFLVVAPDLISPLGGTPRDEDKAQEMQASIKTDDHIKHLVATVAYAAKLPGSDGNVGAIGFCRGGQYANLLAVADPDLKAAAVYYGEQPKTGIDKIKAAMLLHYAGNDKRVNSGSKAYVAALKAAGKTVEMYQYPGTRHAFNNDGRPGRYNKAAATLAWTRTIAFLKKNVH